MKSTHIIQSGSYIASLNTVNYLKIIYLDFIEWITTKNFEAIENLKEECIHHVTKT